MLNKHSMLYCILGRNFKMYLSKNKRCCLARVLMVFLFIIVLVIGSGDILKDLTVKRMSDIMYRGPLNTTDNTQGNFNFKQVKSLGVITVVQAVTNSGRRIARLAIPSIGLHLAVFYGLDNNNLAQGAGTMKRNQVLGEGNYAIAGHYMSDERSLFAPLKQIQKLDKVYLTDNQKVYTYQVTSEQTIDEHRVTVINDVAGEKLLTLVTCDSAISKTSKRFVVQANLVTTETATKSSLAVFN